MLTRAHKLGGIRHFCENKMSIFHYARGGFEKMVKS